jgi:hypothetical protein
LKNCVTRHFAAEHFNPFRGQASLSQQPTTFLRQPLKFFGTFRRAAEARDDQPRDSAQETLKHGGSLIAAFRPKAVVDSGDETRTLVFS